MNRKWLRYMAGFAFWTLVGLFFSTQRVLLSSAEGGAWVDALRRTMPQWYLWGALTPFVSRADAWAKSNGASLGRRLVTHVPLGVFFVSIYVLSRTPLEAALGNVALDWSFENLAAQYHWNLLIYSAIVGALVAYDYHQDVQERALKASQLEARLAEAKLETLKAQLQPHFLFNTLNTISAFIERDPQKARRMMAHLGDLLRHSLEHGGEREIPFSEELALVEDYVAIQQVRFEGKLAVDRDFAPETLSARVPSFLLQPLVENAVEHGLSGHAKAGRITLRSRRRNGTLELSVVDDGVGLPEAGVSEASGVGLRNTSERLEQLYGGSAAMTVADGATGGVDVRITLPFRSDG